MRHLFNRDGHFPGFRLGGIVGRLSLYSGGGGAVEIPADLDKKVVEAIENRGIERFKGTLPKVPDKFELKLPDKAVISDKALERTAAIARELGLTSNEHAAKVLGFANESAQSVLDQLVADHKPGGAAHKAMLEKYADEALKAPDLGDGKPEVLQAKVARATKFVQKYFPKSVQDLLTENGMGSHPDFFRAVLKMADAAKEDGAEGGDPANKGKKSAADTIYGS